MVISFTLNDRAVTIDVPAHYTLLRGLRDAAHQFDVKYGCGEGVCGACAVRLDGVAVNACSVLCVQADGAVVETAAGLTGPTGEPHLLQELFASYGAVQCGFCTPGMLISALDAVELGSVASRDDIRTSLAGSLCRCTGYQAIVDAVEAYRDAVADGGAS
jgi:aerobic carbon-monoxide dehydrogenase small subunit